MIDPVELRKQVGKSKFFLSVACFSIIIGNFVLISTIITLINWNSKISNYTKEYVYSEFGTLYYESDGKKIYIQNIYNTNGEKITLDIPNDQVIIMYIENDNINDGIYINYSKSSDLSIIYPLICILAPCLLISMGLCPILLRKEAKEKKVTLNPVMPFILYLFLVGIIMASYQIYKAANYIELKQQNNITVATIDAQIHTEETKRESYKFVAYYYVDEKKYIYVNDIFKKGTFEDKIGNTFEVYYDKSNPNKISKKEDPIYIPMLFGGIILALGSSPFVFFRRKIEKRGLKNTLKQDENEWKI